ncbi:MAG TPA: metalloregulator ArsR/SmtB family transcription factor [Steroidobacteraceae bacterium]|nr:metalloregulator ArsR/SmtB family transcription factor [Steroidobacteraceae bacterium]
MRPHRIFSWAIAPSGPAIAEHPTETDVVYGAGGIQPERETRDRALGRGPHLIPRVRTFHSREVTPRERSAGCAPAAVKRSHSPRIAFTRLGFAPHVHPWPRIVPTESARLTANTPLRIVHTTVNHQTRRLDRIFLALGDPTRRAILARLARDDALSVSELAEPFAIKLPAVMKHLDVLEDVGLIRRTKVGRTVTVVLSPRPLKTASEWLQRYERFWEMSLDRLTRYAEKKERDAPEGRE